MRKTVFLFLFLSSITMSFARDTVTTVLMTKDRTQGGTHYADVPEVTYDPNENRISVEFEAEGSFTLMVKDVDGQVLYSAPVVINGNSYSYDVNLLPENYYVITITSVDDGYIGVLETEAE